MNLFNSPIELGMRMAVLLLALYPRRVDLQRLVFFDYAVIYSGDLGGPSSLHTPIPLRGTEYTSRREVIEGALYLMATKAVIDVYADSTGLCYSAGEQAASLVGFLSGDYIRDLKIRCEWVAQIFAEIPEQEITRLFRQQGLVWGTEMLAHETVGDGT